MNKDYTGLVFLFLMFVVNMSAQVHQQFCGTPSPTSPIFVDVEKQLSEVGRYNVPPEVVEVFVHFTTDNSGSTGVVDIDTFMARFQDMKEFFFPNNICFLLVGSQIIQDSDLDYHVIFGSGEDGNEQDEILPYLKPGVLNIFVHHLLIHGNITGGGNAYAIPNTYLSIDDGALLAECCRGTLAHEVGHCLGLYHTFQWSWSGSGQNRENVARSGACENCTTQGDLLCDTPADPHELASIGSDTTYLKSVGSYLKLCFRHDRPR